MFCYSVMSIWLKSTSAHLSSSYLQYCVNTGTGRSILYWKESLQSLAQRRQGMSYRSLNSWWVQTNIHQMNYQWIMSSYVSLLTNHTKALLYRTLMNHIWTSWCPEVHCFALHQVPVYSYLHLEWYILMQAVSHIIKAVHQNRRVLIKNCIALIKIRL